MEWNPTRAQEGNSGQCFGALHPGQVGTLRGAIARRCRLPHQERERPRGMHGEFECHCMNTVITSIDFGPNTL